MAAVSAMHSTALAGQGLFKFNELARKVGTSQARVTMAKGSSSSIW
jgi:hypothetical protein